MEVPNELNYFYRKKNQGNGFCPLYRGYPSFGESVIRGFTVSSSPLNNGPKFQLTLSIRRYRGKCVILTTTYSFMVKSSLQMLEVPRSNSGWSILFPLALKLLESGWSLRHDGYSQLCSAAHSK